VQIKADVVMADEKEHRERAHLNFGHTFGHAIEAATRYGEFLHGEAVSLGMVAATQLAVKTGRCEGELLDRLTTLLARIGLPTRSERLGAVDLLLKAMRVDKKVSDGRVRLVLPERMGSVVIVSDVSDADVVRAWEWLRGKG
jgi:3-dehydroquinate synthase